MAALPPVLPDPVAILLVAVPLFDLVVVPLAVVVVPLAVVVVPAPVAPAPLPLFRCKQPVTT
ncbi:hypothetical protein D3C76_1607080 [compost metagenome]